MSKYKTKQRFMAMMLSAIMVVSMMPASAWVETGSFPIGASGEVTAFEALGSDIAVRSVPLGTSETDLELPDSLTATVRLVASEEDPVLDSGEPDSELDSTDEITVPLPVTWASSPEYDGEAADTYLFTPELPEKFTLASGVEVPAITVTVGVPTLTGTVTAFDELPENIRWQNTTAPEFPETVGGTVEGKTVQIPMTWEADHDYDAEYPQRGLYVFTAVLGEGYSLADGVELPRMTVYIPQMVGGMMARMAGSGTTDSPLEITTAAQLAEIATLVNARPNGLELFLFNDAGAKVSLKLQNDIDLSVYAKGEGWVPIGVTSNRFKGTFDGGGNRITGLYINRNEHFQGLFGCVGSVGTIRNIGVENVNITGGNFVGGLAGYIDGLAENCYSNGSVIGGTQSIGGVVGIVTGTVQNCYSAATVSGNLAVGGVVGSVTGTVQNCYSAGTVSGGSYVGGVVGYGPGTVQNCAALNPAVAVDKYCLGRVVGDIFGGTLSGNYAFSGMTVTKDGKAKTPVEGADQVDGESKTAADIRTAGFFEALFGNDTSWTYAEGKLPGFGAVLDLPEYIADTSDPNFRGAGTSEDPYQIATHAQLAKLSELVTAGNPSYHSAHYKLMNDLDLSTYASADGGKGWSPIGWGSSNPFGGSFDGNGKTVSGLSANRPMTSCVGLFGFVSGTVKNLSVVDVNLRSSGYMGGVAGYVNGTVKNCYSTGSILGSARFNGGIAGGLNGTVESCYSTANVSGLEVNGGVVGYVYGGRVINCAALAPAVGGAQSGRVVGVAYDATFSGNIAFSGMTVNGNTVSGGTATSTQGAPKTAAEISTEGFFEALFVGDPVWTYEKGKLPGFGAAVSMPAHLIATGAAPFDGSGTSESDPYLIKTAADLAKLAEMVNVGTSPYADPGRYYKLQNDLDLSAYGEDCGGGKGWTPIGTDMTYAFKGNFDGNNKNITGLTINRPTSDNIGLFGYLYPGSKVRNIRIIDASVSGNTCVGGAVGCVWGATVENCAVTGSVSGAERVGGIVGFASSGKVQGCYSTGSVTGTGDYVGGVVGYLEYIKTTVQRCYSDSSVSGSNAVGGVAGEVGAGTVQNCYSTGNVTGSLYVGSVAGRVGGGTVENCYSTGSVTGTEYVGGVVGLASRSTVKNCVALNPSINVGEYNFGRVVGSSPSSTLLNNYAFSHIPGTWENKGSGAKDGADVTSQTLFGGSFWTTADNWDSAPWDSGIWTFADSKLPTLTGLAGQSGDGGLYLTARDIQYATVSTGSFTYNRSEQIPTITFDGETLIKDTDYTVSITSTDGSGTSAGTNAGEVTLTITGIGSFKGTQTVTYTIGKASLTISSTVINPKSYDGTTTAEVANVNFHGLLLTETLTMGTDYTVTDAQFNSADAGDNKSVTATVSLTNTAKANNYSLASGGLSVTGQRIEKRQITLTADNKTIVKGGVLPGLTYTISNLPIGKTKADALSIEPVLACPIFDGNTPGSYAITLTGGTATDNYKITTRTNGILTVAEQTYTVTFNLNGGTRTGGGELTQTVTEGGAATAPTVTRSNYTFTGWDKAFDNVTSNLTATARWRYDGGGGGGSSSDRSPIIVTPPAADKPNSPTQGEIKVPGTVDSEGNITVNITDKTVTDAFEKALAEAKKNGNEQNGITLILYVDIGSKTGSNVTVNLPKTVQNTIIAKKIVNIIIAVDNPNIRIGMDLATMQEINKQAKSDVNITATHMDSGKLTGDAKKAIGSRPAFDLRVNYGSGTQVQSFGAGCVSVSIPYTLAANEKAGNVQAVYVDAKGKVHWLINSVYDSVEKVLRFSTDHFSTYGIGYKQINIAFIDIAGHWAKEDIEFVVSRGLFSGTSTTIFSPNTAMTRGMFVTALGRLANADVSSFTKSSFTDVKSDAYYTGYIEWASKNSIVTGTSNGKFAPDQSITHEQVAVIMQNYAKIIGFTLPNVHTENIFADNAKINAYAKEAVKQMQMAGVISGKNGNLFDPQGTATRAEVSAVLRRFVELAISNDTAQGWTMNDSGKWMYYENGKPVTGKKDIDGSTYTFDQYGVTADVPKNLRYTTYTVQKGDSFWSIARKLGCPMSELERLNNKSQFTIIHPGDVLRVPEK